uniref:Uncharacterized protein n=1 Tax=Panagrolaimus sp. PS1159 TaxID=55785 RepID=A0AC35GB48_9BILA
MECVYKVANQLKLDKSRWIIYDDALTDILTGHYALMLLIRCNDLKKWSSESQNYFNRSSVGGPDRKKFRSFGYNFFTFYFI